MTIWIIAFYISLAGMITIVAIGRYESRDQMSIFCRLSRRSDIFFRFLVAVVRRIASYMNKRTLAAAVHLVAYHILLRIRNVYVEIKHRVISNPHGKRLIDAVRGRGEVKYHGASFYLRRIGDK